MSSLTMGTRCSQRIDQSCGSPQGASARSPRPRADLRTWLISPETLVGHLLNRRALAIRALSHLLRTGRTRLWGAAVHVDFCVVWVYYTHHAGSKVYPTNTQASPKHTCVQREAQTGIRTCSTTPGPPTDHNISQTHHPICTPALTLDDMMLGRALRAL
jgi:hypothetical protein